MAGCAYDPSTLYFAERLGMMLTDADSQDSRIVRTAAERSDRVFGPYGSPHARTRMKA